MRFAINVPNFGDFGDARLVAELARAAEEAGWDAFFLWDHIGADWEVLVADPWIELAAVALATERIHLGPMVTPVPRRRPWKLAREAVTLDRLSRGRLILGVGLGADFGREYSAYGESPDDRLHGAMLNEALEVLTGLWSGEPFSYSGEHYRIDNACHLPRPLQTPRIPIWVAGTWPKRAPFRRAARWDGVAPIGPEGSTLGADEIRELVAYVREHRTSDAPYEVMLGGKTYEWPAAEVGERLAAYAAAGLTWWSEGFDWTNTLAEARERIRQGPPKAAGG
jgi:alkanesulfonate monooxygenase SsuD/methylene tetrahydromethanopterin reductase-like flavin-dependent oxidoreductase (luciferase family)